MAELVRYDVDGVTMQSEFHLPQGEGPHPGIIVFPEIFGLSELVRTKAARLAELGYAALASDLYGDSLLLGDLDEARALMGPMRAQPERIRDRARAGLAALAERPEVDASRLAAVGFCFGGSMALELARGGADLKGVVGFHSGLATHAPEDAKNIRGRVLVCIGADDPSIPPEQRLAFEEEMRGGGVNWQLTVFGGVVHSFTNPGADKVGRLSFARYDAQADARSWAQMRTLFDEIF